MFTKIHYLCKRKQHVINNIMTREEALKRWEAAKKKKKETVAWMVDELTKEVIKRTGKAPQNIEVW